MQNAQFPVRRLVDGTIDYAFYRAEAARLRQQARQRFWQGIGGWWAGRLSALTSRPSQAPRYRGQAGSPASSPKT
jgi:hypothetical protein